MALGGGYPAPLFRIICLEVTSSVRCWAALLFLEVLPMFERLLAALAAVATIAMFLLEAWQAWKEAVSDHEQEDDASVENKTDR